MKRIFHHPTGPTTGKAYWRSLDELEGSPEFRAALEREFPAGAHELETDGLSRRAFLRLMGASVALAGVGMTGCARRPELHAVPYTKSPEWIIAGRATQYATAMPRLAGAIPLLVTTYEGRPTHLAGNEMIPGGYSGLDVIAQASILDLYDPDRARFFKEAGKEVGLPKFAEKIKALAEQYTANQGEGFAIFTEFSTSPTRARLLKELSAKMPKMVVATPESFRHDRGYRELPRFDKAEVIFSLGSDFLGGEEYGLAAVRGFAAGRRVKKPGDKMNRLYTVESRLTTTGSMSDHRLSLKAGQQAAFLYLVAQELVASGGAFATLPLTGLSHPSGFSEHQKIWAKELAADLLSSKRALIVVGPGLAPEVADLASALNQAFGENLSETLEQVAAFPTFTGSVSASSLQSLMDQGQIKTLITIGVNPAFTLAKDNWVASQKKVTESIHLSLSEDETSVGSAWQVPLAHYLESWGDLTTDKGYYVSQQPMILPLFGAVSELELLSALNGNSEALKPYVYPKPAEMAKPHLPGQSSTPFPIGYQLIKETFSSLYRGQGTNLESAWMKTLHDGYASLADLAPSAQAPALTLRLASSFVSDFNKALLTTASTGLEVTFYSCPKIGDGRGANNGWLQELPDFVNKLNWDNAALISRATAKQLGITKSGEMILIESAGASLEIPALISPGQSDNSIAVALGYGRTHVGQVGSGVGFNAYTLTTGPGFLSEVTARKTGKTYKLAITQDHGSMEGRGLVREATLAQYNQEPAFAKKMHMDGHVPPNDSIYKHPYTDPQEKGPQYAAPISTGAHQWGMVIDLSTCVGCNACTIACQSENNIPIVGKEQVINSRMMQWIRIDRYYSDSPEEPQVAAQPVLCQHCENAPCEAVCPVNATVHTDEGLNIIAYNRCIGTRYCANNCPYKVRRFNYFDYNARDVLAKTKIGPVELGNLYLGPLGKEGSPETVQLQRNPNVTVRVRGVIEKCSFCVQRIEEARADALVAAKDSDNTKIKPDSFKTACQVGCPAEAIVFGDISNPASEVSKLRGSDREYSLLGYLNTRPRVTYLARVRNPNLRMPGAEKIGWGSDWDKLGPYSEESQEHTHSGSAVGGESH